MSDQDQNFFDMFVLVLGILVGVTFGLILLARYVAGHTQKQWVLEDPVYQQQVSTRLEPFGDVALPGEDFAGVDGAVEGDRDGHEDAEPREVAGHHGWRRAKTP